MSILDEMVLLSGGIALLFLIMVTIAGSNPAIISGGVLVIWSVAIASKFEPTSCGRVMPTVFTHQGWEDLGTTVSFLCGNGRHSKFYSELPNCVSG
jgi:hypothetical protein